MSLTLSFTSRVVQLAILISRILFTVLFSPVLIILTIPPIQRLLVYLHWINFPFGKLSDPIVWGYRSHTARSIFIPTSDHLHLGAWHLISPSPSSLTLSSHNNEITPNLLHRPSYNEDKQYWSIQPNDIIYIYFHGNAGNRAVRHRRALYQVLFTAHMRSTRSKSDRGRAHLLAVDYRGFGDSSPMIPTENGIMLDAITAWNYVINDLGASPQQVILVGHSLGTGVATALTSSYLSTTDQSPRGLILFAPYTSIPNAAMDYPWVPLWLLGSLSFIIRPLITENWPTIDHITQTQCPVLMIHGHGDSIIPHHHTYSLFKRVTGYSITNDSNDSMDKCHKLSMGKEGNVYSATCISSGHMMTAVDVLPGHHDDLHEFALVRDSIAHWLTTLS